MFLAKMKKVEIQEGIQGEVVLFGQQGRHGGGFTIHEIVMCSLQNFLLDLMNLCFSILALALNDIHMVANLFKRFHHLQWPNLAGRSVLSVKLQRHMKYNVSVVFHLCQP